MYADQIPYFYLSVRFWSLQPHEQGATRMFGDKVRFEVCTPVHPIDVCWGLGQSQVLKTSSLWSRFFYVGAGKGLL